MPNSISKVKAKIVFIQSRHDEKYREPTTLVYLAALSGKLHLSEKRGGDTLTLRTAAPMLLLVDNKPSQEEGGRHCVTLHLLDWRSVVLNNCGPETALSAYVNNTWSDFGVWSVSATKDPLDALEALGIFPIYSNLDWPLG